MRFDDNTKLLLTEFADAVIDEDKLQEASVFLSLNVSNGDWRVASHFLRRLLKRMSPHQAPAISYLLDEFMPLNTTHWALKLMRQIEENKYTDLGLAWGIARCMYWQAAQTPEGRSFLQACKGRF